MTAAVLALVATLSRYEAWPVAAFVFALCAARARSDRRAIVAALVAIAGPVFWLANNVHAHGDALHFVARVAAFRRASGASLTMAQRILEYPVALFDDAREILALAAVFAVAAVSDRALRARWVLSIGGTALVLAFLIYGDVRDCAPTHHAARALGPLMVGLAAAGAVGGGARTARLVASRERIARLVLPVVAGACIAHDFRRVRYAPASSESERRDAQIARGYALAGATSLDVTPCAYEHFALLAAFSAPERATIAPLTHEPVTPDCPRVAAR